MTNRDTSFSPQKVHDNFISITQVSHPSGKENPLRELIIRKVREIQDKYSDERKNLEIAFYKPGAIEPGNRVILLRRPGAGPYKEKKPVILQGHLDMVTVPGEDIFPLKVIKVEDEGGKWLKGAADFDNPGKGGTTLGADNGLGVAVILALSEDADIKQVPLECLFTVQEETNMGGAGGLSGNLLTGNSLINLDAEDLKVIIYGSAGGSNTCVKGQVARNRTSESYTFVKLTISGFKSGHSGIDINKGRKNAIKVLSEILSRLQKGINAFSEKGGIGSYHFQLHSFTRSDEVKANSIPASASAVVAVEASEADMFVKDFHALCELCKRESLPVENVFFGAADKDDRRESLLTEDATINVLSLIGLFPHGVIKMLPGHSDLVETSTNLYNVIIADSDLIVESSNRSSNMDSLVCLNVVQAQTAKCFGFEATTGIDRYPGWEPDDRSPLLKAAREVYGEFYGSAYDATVIHAGLECGFIKARCGEHMDCISLGPNIRNPHTEREMLQIVDENNDSPVDRFYRSVISIINRIIVL